jgi:hypothetical protein
MSKEGNLIVARVPPFCVLVCFCYLGIFDALMNCRKFPSAESFVTLSEIAAKDIVAAFFLHSWKKVVVSRLWIGRDLYSFGMSVAYWHYIRELSDELFLFLCLFLWVRALHVLVRIAEIQHFVAFNLIPSSVKGITCSYMIAVPKLVVEKFSAFFSSLLFSLLYFYLAMSSATFLGLKRRCRHAELYAVEPLWVSIVSF